MKNILLIALLFFSSLGFSQDQTQQLEEKIYELSELDLKPEYSKGIEAFYKFIAKNFNIPEEEGLKGKIIISFVIENDGSLSNMKVLQDVGFDTGDEAIRVLKMSEKWKPGQKDGKTVRVLYSFPITIQSAS